MRKNIIFVVAVAFMVSSCSIYKKYEPVNDTRSEAKAEGSQFGELQWREVFTDTQLQGLIEKALQQNIDLQKSHLAVQQMEASLKAAKLGYLPSIGLNPSAGYNGMGSNAELVYSLPVAIDWQLDIFGRNTTAKRKANAITEEYKDLEQATKAELIASVAKAYYSLAMIDNQIKIADTTISIREKALETQQALMDAGLSNSAAVSQFAAELSGLRVQIGGLQRQFNEVRNALSLLVSENLDGFQCGAMDATFPEIGNIEIASVNLLSRPDVRAAQHDLEAAFYAEKGAVAEFWPSINIGGNAGVAFNPTNFVWSVMGSLFQPIFQRGQLNANLKIAQSQQEQARLEFEKTLMTAAVDINNALCGLNTAQSASSHYAEQEAHYQDAYFATNELMKRGSGSYLEVLFAQQALLESSLARVANDYEAVCAMISLYLALGGGD